MADMKLLVLAMILLAACLLAAPVRAEHNVVFHDRGLEQIVDLPARGELVEAGRLQPATLASWSALRTSSTAQCGRATTLMSCDG